MTNTNFGTESEELFLYFLIRFKDANDFILSSK